MRMVLLFFFFLNYCIIYFLYPLIAFSISLEASPAVHLTFEILLYIPYLTI